MGCSSSKTVCRTNSLQENLTTPFHRVTAIPIFKDFLLAHDHDQFLAVICRARNLEKKFPSTTELETILSSVSIDKEADPKFQALMKEKRMVEKSISITDGKISFDACIGSLLKEEGLENKKPEEEAKLEIINTWELMEGLEDEEIDSDEIEVDSVDRVSVQNSKIYVESIDESALPSISRTFEKSKSVEMFQTVEDYRAFLARTKRPLWTTDSKSLFYHLGPEQLELTADSRLNSLHKSASLPPQSKTPAATVIDWTDDLECNDHRSSEMSNSSPVIQTSYGQSATKNEISSQQNNDVAEILSGNNENQENNFTVDIVAANDNIAEGNSQKDHPPGRNSTTKKLHARAKVNELGGINIPSTPDLSAVGSLKEWLYGGGHLYSPGIATTPKFGYTGIWSRSSRPDDRAINVQASRNDCETETVSHPVSSTDKQMEITGELGFHSDSGVSVVENEHCDYAVFDPDLLAYFEKALEQLSEEEQNVLRQIDGDSNRPSGEGSPS